MKNSYQTVNHTFEPIYDKNSKILILGTIPSPKSRENVFYYGNPKNRFWRVLSAVLDEALPENNEQRTALLLRNKIALWDVLKSCDIKGGSDSSIKNPVANDILPILDSADIKAVFTTGKRAFELYNRLILPESEIEAICLPSPSPANCAVSIDELVEKYRVILEWVK